MASHPDGAGYVWLAEPTESQPGIKAFYRPDEDAIHIVFDDRGLHHPSTGHGMWVTFNGNPRSANYWPDNANRVNDLIRDLGCSVHRAERWKEGPRRLGKRGVA